MKKFHFCFLFFIVTINTYSQSPIKLSFKGLDSETNTSVHIDSVYIKNVTQDCDTTLFSPITKLSLNAIWPVGIKEPKRKNNYEFELNQNFPNPFNGSTNVTVYRDYSGPLNLILLDCFGKKLAEYHDDFEEGINAFTISSSGNRVLILDVFDSKNNQSIKLICNGQVLTSNAIQYDKYIDSQEKNTIKSAEISGFKIILGNQMAYTAYANGYSYQTITDNPKTDAEYNFKLSKESDVNQKDSMLFNKGKLVFSFDDGFISQYTIGLPLFLSKGIKATFYAYGFPVNGTMNMEQKKAMFDAGMDIQNHDSFLGQTDEYIIQKTAESNAYWAAAGIKNVRHHCYSAGEYDFHMKDLLKDYYVTCRGTNGGKDIYRDSDKYSLGSYYIDDINNSAKLDAVKAKIDLAVANKTALTIYGHDINGSGGIPTAYLEAIIDYAKSVDIDIITIDELYQQMIKANNPPKMADMTLTATGTGEGISKLKITSDEDITLTLSGNAKFYTNAAATLNESSVWEMKGGTIRTIYIKLASGEAKFNLPVTKLRGINEWTSPINAPMLSGDIGVFLNLNDVNINSNSNITGDLTKLKKINYLLVASGNTLYGDITGLTKLTYLHLLGSNTITGNISGLTLLTRLQVNGSNTVYGSLNAISDGLAYCYLYPCGRITYSVGGNWLSLNNTLNIKPSTGKGMTSAEVDLLINEVSATKNATKAVFITLTGSSAKRTSLSKAAVDDIVGDGGSVITN